MRILFVNHTFPPESYAGSELCVLNLAREMQRLGHDVFVFYRYGNADDEEYALQKGEFQSLPVYKINNTYRFIHKFQDIYLNSAIAAKFGYLLREIKPDVVHFHHLTNLSLSLVQEAKTYGSAVVTTLHDYWLLCQRGQLLKQDLTLCHGPSDSACRSCLAVQLLRGKSQRIVSRLGGLARSRNTPSNVLYNLLDLSITTIRTPDKNFVAATTFNLGGVDSPVLLAHPPAEVCYHLQLKSPAKLQTAVAMHPSTYQQEGGGVTFEVRFNGEPIFSKTLNPKKELQEQTWYPVEIDLPSSSGERNELVLLTTPEIAGDNRFCTAGWREPVILSSTPNQNHSSHTTVMHSNAIRKAAGWAASAVAAFSGEAREGIEHRKNWVQRVWNDVDLFISPSRFLRDFFIRHGMPPAKILFSDNGFEYPADTKDRGFTHPVRFGYIGTWIPSKGVDIALQAFRDMDPLKAKLVLHGFFPGFDGYENYEDELRGLAGGAVEFRGKYDPREVYRLLDEIDCLVMPSIWWENSPMTIHEAFAAGVPIITADVGGMAEQVQNGGGLTFRHRDAGSLRSVVDRIISNPELLSELRKSIPPVKTVKEHTEEVLSIYARLVKQKQ